MKEKNNIDELFRKGLQGRQAAFDASHWESMETLLDARSGGSRSKGIWGILLAVLCVAGFTIWGLSGMESQGRTLQTFNGEYMRATRAIALDSDSILFTTTVGTEESAVRGEVGTNPEANATRNTAYTEERTGLSGAFANEGSTAASSQRAEESSTASETKDENAGMPLSNDDSAAEKQSDGVGVTVNAGTQGLNSGNQDSTDDTANDTTEGSASNPEVNQNSQGNTPEIPSLEEGSASADKDATPDAPALAENNNELDASNASQQNEEPQTEASNAMQGLTNSQDSKRQNVVQDQAGIGIQQTQVTQNEREGLGLLPPRFPTLGASISPEMKGENKELPNYKKRGFEFRTRSVLASTTDKITQTGESLEGVSFTAESGWEHGVEASYITNGWEFTSGISTLRYKNTFETNIDTVFTLEYFETQEIDSISIEIIEQIDSTFNQETQMWDVDTTLIEIADTSYIFTADSAFVQSIRTGDLKNFEQVHNSIEIPFMVGKRWEYKRWLAGVRVGPTLSFQTKISGVYQDDGTVLMRSDVSKSVRLNARAEATVGYSFSPVVRLYAMAGTRIGLSPYIQRENTEYRRRAVYFGGGLIFAIP